MLFRRLASEPKPPRLQHGDLADIAGSPVRLKVNARARRISLRLDSSRAEVVLTAPSVRHLPDALRFALSRRGWIEERLAALPSPIALQPGAVIEVAGAPCRLERAAMRIRPQLKPAMADEPQRLIASGDGAAFARAAERALRVEALARLGERTAAHCASLGEPTPPVALQDAATRWGSCRPAHAGAQASIRYNWRLLLAPPSVLDYVAAHECAHLLEANHGPRFWTLVRRLYGDPAPARTWLKLNGARLQAVGRG